MNRRTFGLALATGVLVLWLTQSPALAQCELGKVHPGDANGLAFFGESVAIAGEAALVGVPHDAWRGRASGAAYVFRSDGPEWVREARLTAADGDEWEEFGASVALSGDIALIGAPGHSQADPPKPGAVYVFGYDGQRWIEKAKLVASDGSPRDRFGRAVALAGDTAVVGAWLDDDHGPSSGSAYIFRRDGSAWVEEAKLVPFDGGPGDGFGLAVTVSSGLLQWVVIGAWRDDDNGAESGSAYVFRADGSTWIEEAKLTPADPAPYQVFGAAVAISGSTVLVGAHGDDENGWFSGAAYVFQYDGQGWIEQAKLLAFDGEMDDTFGLALALSGDPPNLAVIGAWRDDDNGPYSGSAYVFRRDSSRWVEEAKLLASDGEEQDEFGCAVAVYGRTALVGARHDYDGDNAGAAYFFDLDPIPGDLDCDGAVGQPDLGILLADWGCPSDCVGDIDGDDDTDQDDLAILLDNWGNTRS